MNIKKSWKILWGVLLVLVWACLIFLFVKSNGGLTVEQIVNYKPASTLVALLAMLGLFLLKSVDFIMYSGILYAASGIMFPLIPALLLNLVGMVIMLSIPYAAGKIIGTPLVEQLMEKHPKLQEAAKLRSGGEVMIAVLLRAIGTPLHVASIYMGAMGYRFDRYMLGSLLGILPEMITLTVIGTSASDASSPAFWIAVAVKLCISALSIITYNILKKKSVPEAEG